MNESQERSEVTGSFWQVRSGHFRCAPFPAFIAFSQIDPAGDFDELIGVAVLRAAIGILHKMTGDVLDEFPEALLPLLEISDEAVRIELTKELLDFVAKVFEAHNRQVDEKLLSRAIKPILRGKERTMIKSIFDEKYDEGVIDCEARGIAEGTREAVLTFLRTRFHRIPKNVEKAIRAMTNPIGLDSRTAQAAACRSMDKFAEALL